MGLTSDFLYTNWQTAEVNISTLYRKDKTNLRRKSAQGPGKTTVTNIINKGKAK